MADGAVFPEFDAAKAAARDQSPNAAADALTVARLAVLTVGDYDRARVAEAAALGWRVDTLDSEVHKARRAALSVSDDEPDRPPAFSDEALALRFTERHKDRLRYVAKWGRWLIRQPAVWHFDETMQAFDLARMMCREAASECNDLRIASSTLRSVGWLLPIMNSLNCG